MGECPGGYGVMGVYGGPTLSWIDLSPQNSLNGLVTNGLVLALDAGRTLSYPGSGTTWSDLSGLGNNGTLVNGVGYSGSNLGSLSFDGVDDRGTFTSPITSSSPQSYEVWVKAIPSNTADEGFGYILHNNSATNIIGTAYMGIGYAGRTLQTREIFAFFNGAWINMGTGVIGNTTTVRQIVLTWNGSTQIAYVDGVQRVSQSLTTTPSNFSSTTSFGDFRDNTYRPIVGDIYSIKAYNRALTASEIQQNFIATRSRFSI
jgi:hypothetical protein